MQRRRVRLQHEVDGDVRRAQQEAKAATKAAEKHVLAGEEGAE